MKIPKTFTVDRDLDHKIEKYKNGEVYRPETLIDLLEGCKSFLREKSKYLKYRHLDNLFIMPEVWEIGERIAGEMNYTKYDLEELSKQVNVKELKIIDTGATTVGVYVSMLVNKIIKENETITLFPVDKLTGLGGYLKKGILVVDGDVDKFAGFEMEGEKLMITGSAGYYLGEQMKSGKLIVQGDVEYVTSGMGKDAEIFVYGKNHTIVPSKNRWGKVFYKDKLVWPRK